MRDSGALETRVVDHHGVDETTDAAHSLIKIGKGHYRAGDHWMAACCSGVSYKLFQKVGDERNAGIANELYQNAMSHLKQNESLSQSH